MKVWFIFGVLIFFVSDFCFSQTVEGVVKDEYGNLLVGVNVYSKEFNFGTTTNLDGEFELEVNSSTTTLNISYLGYDEYLLKLNADRTRYDVLLTEDNTQLQEVLVLGKTKSEIIKEYGFNVEVVETQKIKNSNKDLNQVLKSVSGINIRQSGGLGSSFKLSLNGLTGNQIRYFIDGVPMENFGSSFSLNNFLVNQVESIEIYKGIVPIRLGADALGGAINIITQGKRKTNLDISYSFGSFNTHRTSVSGQYYHPKKGFFLRSSSFFNHSDNNYMMYNVPVYDLDLGNLLGTINTRRFHDHYTSGMTSFQIGVLDKKYADELSINVFFAKNRKNYQHPDNNILLALGDYHATNETLWTSLVYKKKLNKLKLQANLILGNSVSKTIDTINKKYNWTEDFAIREVNNIKGELFDRKTLFEFKDKFVKSNIYASYRINKQHTIKVNFIQNYLNRKGDDKVNQDNLLFENPNQINKNILGINYDFNSNNKKLRSSIFGKYYTYNAKVITYDFENKKEITKPSLQNTGYGSTLSYAFSKYFQSKFSIEKAFRIPEPKEILGDGIYTNPNQLLKPEESLNINLGGHYKQRLDDAKVKFSSEINLFYRDAKNFIRFNPVGNFGKYENLQNINSNGVEVGINAEYKSKYSLSINFTYQNLTDQSEFDDGFVNTNYKSSLPNIPYLFGNMRIGIQPFQLKNQETSIYWHTRYVHEFFLTWENLGDSRGKHIIPEQILHDIEIDYSFQKKYNASILITNLFSALAYDNFNIQKPGRAMSLKLRYSI